MSAFILSDKHTSTLALLLVKPEHAQGLADRLKAVNIASVNHRYNEKTPKRKCKMATLEQCLNVSMHGLHKLYQCWDYQSCEGDLLDYQILAGYLDTKFEKLGFTSETINNSTVWSI